MRVLAATSGTEGSHTHHHDHQIEKTEKVAATSTAVETSSSSSSQLRSRAKVGVQSDELVTGDPQNTQKEASASLKLSAYLNLFGDFSKCFSALLPEIGD